MYFGMKGGTGNADLYVRYGALPSLEEFDYASRRPWNVEAVDLRNPSPGDWYVMIVAQTTVRGAGFAITLFGPPPLRVATPVIQPAGGAYHHPVSVLITSATPGAEVRYTLDGSDPTPTSLTEQPILLSNSAVVRARAYKFGWLPSLPASASFTVVTNTVPGLPPYARRVDLERFGWIPHTPDGTRGTLIVPSRWAYRYIGLSGDYSMDFLGKLLPNPNGTYEVQIPPRTKLIVQLHGAVFPDRAMPKQAVVLEYSFDPRRRQNLLSSRVLHYSYKTVWVDFRDWTWLTRSSPAPNWYAFELIKR
jgi:hypothetical protein